MSKKMIRLLAIQPNSVHKPGEFSRFIPRTGTCHLCRRHSSVYSAIDHTLQYPYDDIDLCSRCYKDLLGLHKLTVAFTYSDNGKTECEVQYESMYDLVSYLRSRFGVLKPSCNPLSDDCTDVWLEEDDGVECRRSVHCINANPIVWVKVINMMLSRY